MTKRGAQRIASQARLEATEWFVSFREADVDAQSREAFYAWLRKAPDNVHAYLRIAALWQDTGLLKESELFDRDALLRRALQSSNVLELDPVAIPAAPERTRTTARRSLLRLALAAAVLFVVVGSVGWFTLLKDTYSTDIGEQRTVALRDGSTIIINARSRIRVRLGARQRDVDLFEGQAIFRVAHDSARPFVVHSGSTNVRAVGTQFDVYRKSSGTTVTVLEGAVAIGGQHQSEPASTRTRPAEDPGQFVLTAGEQMTISPLATSAPKRADIAAATAWTQGKLIFNETPVSEVVAEFNRFSTRRLVIDDPQLQALHISGVFPSSDPGRVAELLRRRFGVTVQQRDDEIRIVRQ